MTISEILKELSEEISKGEKYIFMRHDNMNFEQAESCFKRKKHCIWCDGKKFRLVAATFYDNKISFYDLCDYSFNLQYLLTTDWEIHCFDIEKERFPISTEYKDQILAKIKELSEKEVKT